MMTRTPAFFFQGHGTQIFVHRPRLRDMMQPQQQQMQTTLTTPSQEPMRGEAPPKQVATALDRLAQAARLIADVRLGADRILEALFVAPQPHQTTKTLHFFSKEDAAMRKHLQELRSLGRLLEETGVINESLRSRSNSWGLHMPVVCPDGAVVAYAWKRQLAGQAGASAVDRTRLALKAFTDQKRRFFPYLDDGQDGHGCESAPKRRRGVRGPPESHEDNENEYKTLADVLAYVEKEASTVKIFRHQRLDWLKRAFALPSSADENMMDPSKEYSFHRLERLRPSPVEAVPPGKVAVIELLVPCIFRAVISLHPADSVDPDSVAFFSPDEGGSYVHSRGRSLHHVFRLIADHAGMALQFFSGIKSETALLSLLHWICSYQSLFTKVCSKCGRLLSMDRRSSLLLPPVYRPYVNFSLAKASTLNTISTTEQGENHSEAYHVGCFSEEHGQAHSSTVIRS